MKLSFSPIVYSCQKLHFFKLLFDIFGLLKILKKILHNYISNLASNFEIMSI